MTVIRPNSISGITSITAHSQSIEFYKSDGNLSGANLDGVNINTAGILTAANFKTGVSNLHDVGLTLSGGQLDVGSNIKLGNAGVITATSFVGSGANLTGITAGLSNIVEDTSPQLGGNLDSNGNNIKLGDSSSSNDDRLQIGAATFGDLELFHDGTNSYIDNATNDLYIRNTGDDIIIQAADNITLAVQGGENGIAIAGNGGVELYNDNVRRLYTRSNGITVQGNSSGAGIDFSTDTTHRATVFANNAGEIGFLDTNGNFRLRVTGTTDVQCFNHFNPSSNNTYDLGSTSLRWRNIYINDLNLSNEGSTNIVDNTWGDWTLQEGENDVFMINNRSGKKFKIKMEEVE